MQISHFLQENPPQISVKGKTYNSSNVNLDHFIQ
jgi:hypothetical protein